MKRHDCEQGSPKWFDLHCGKVTASVAGSLVTPLWKVRTGEMLRTLLATKLAEAWIGPLPGFTTWDTEQGKLLEERAIPKYELLTSRDVERVGFIESDDGRSGCSPDGLIGDEGLEIKCLQPIHHVKCLLDGELPSEFAVQVQFSMFVTGAERWQLFLYSQKFPHLLLSIDKDEKAQQAISQAMDTFAGYFDDGMDALTMKNGGVRPTLPSTSEETERPKFTWERESDVPIP